MTKLLAAIALFILVAFIAWMVVESITILGDE